MPGEVIDRPNPQPSPSNLPDNVLSLAVKVEKKTLPEDVNSSLKEFRRAACYIAAAMIFLRDNAFLERDLSFDDIKPRLLGMSVSLLLYWVHSQILELGQGRSTPKP